MFNFKRLIPLIILVVAVCVFVTMFMDNVIKSQLEKSLERTLAVPVSIGNLKTTLSPLSLKIWNIQIASSQDEYLNALVIKKIAMTVETWPLFKKKVIIPEITIDGVVFNAKRKRSSGLKWFNRRLAKERAKEKFEAQKRRQKNQARIRSINKLLSSVTSSTRKKLESNELVKAGDALKQSLANQQKEWEKALDFSTTEKKINQIASDFDKISKGNLNFNNIAEAQKNILLLQSLLTNVSSLQSEINQKTSILDNQVKEATRQIDNLKTVGEKEYKKVLSTLPTKDLKSGDIFKMIVADSVSPKVRNLFGRVMKVRSTVSQYVSTKPEKTIRKHGQVIHFPVTDKTPGLWVKRIRVSGRSGSSYIKGLAKDITSDQRLIGRPTVMWAKGKNMFKPLCEFDTQTTLDFSRGSRVATKMAFTKMDLPEFQLLKSGDGELRIQPLQSQFKFAMDVNNDAINGHFSFFSTDFKVRNSAPAKQMDLMTIVGRVMANNPDVKVSGKVWGTVKDPKFSFVSNLDQLIAKSIELVIQDQINAFMKQIEKEVMAQVGQLQNQLFGELGQFEGLMNGQLGGLQDQLFKQKGLIDGQLFKSQNFIGTEQKKVQDAAQKQIEQQQRSLQNEAQKQLQNQLKNFKLF